MYLYQDKNFEAFMLGKNCIYFKYFQNAEINVEDVERGFQLHDEFNVTDQVIRIIHSEKYVSIAKEARELLESAARPAKVEAYIIPSLPHKIVFNMHKRVRSANHPVRAFDSLDNALFWIKSFL